MDKKDKKDKQIDSFHPHDVWPPPPRKQDDEFEKKAERAQVDEETDPNDMMVYDIESPEEKDRAVKDERDEDEDEDTK